jgi:hypothetical protein
MARFLSTEWFAEVARSAPTGSTPPAAAQPDEPRLVLEQLVRDTPDGEVRYRVIVTGRTARIEPPPLPADGGALVPDLTIASDWATARDLAQGQISAQAALMAGRLRVRGSWARLSGWGAGLAGLDPVPPDVRRRTTY